MNSSRLDNLQVPSTSTFSFKAPFPGPTATPSSSSSASSPISSPLKQRRVSLALPSAPRIVQAWDFRDDTGLDSHVPETEAAHQLMPEKRGKMRKITAADEEDLDAVGGEKEKRQRRKWSAAETQMLVDGCNRHGVGNWKTILGDPNLKFDNRSPVDLKDRFRTYFPDAYKQHYPNARTHLSSKVRSTLPDGTSLFEKTRSKRRRPFTEEEDHALKAGYEKHGTVWATIVKDPVFRDQARRSTDLRDRFRNAFPELYQAAGYKPRNVAASGAKPKAKKGFTKQAGRGAGMGVRAATDDQLAMSSTGMGMGATGPVRSRRRAHTTGLLRGGTKSVPQSTVCSEDEDSDSGVDELDPEEYVGLPSVVFKSPPTPVLVDNVSTLPTRRFGGSTVGASNIKPGKVLGYGARGDPFGDEVDVDMVTLEQLSSDPLGTAPLFLPAGKHDMDTPSQAWSSGVNTPTHSQHGWSAVAGSPTSSQLSIDYEYLLNSGNHPHPHSPSLNHAHSATTNNMEGSNMIGKSAWGTQDWLFSSNPRLDHTSSTSASNSSSSYFSPDADAHSPGLSLSPPPFSLAFPFTHHALTSSHSHLSSHAHGVFDRYDLLPSSSSLSLSHHAHLHDFASDIGAGGGGADGFSDADAEFPPSGFRGFTHHSSYAGDLIFGARGLGSGMGAGPGQGYCGPGPGSGGEGAGAFGYGLGLSGVGGGGAGGGIHPMQMALPGIDEIEIAGITLEDHGQGESHQQSDADGDVAIKSPGSGADTGGDVGLSLGINGELSHSHSQTHQHSMGKDETRRPTLIHSHSLSHLTAEPHPSHPKFNLDLDDLVDFSRSQHPDNGSELDLDVELHATPPATPILTSLSFLGPHAGLSTSSRPKSARRSSESTEFHDHPNYNHDQNDGLHQHGRSISVPPSEARVRTSAAIGGAGACLGSRLGRGQERRNASRNSAIGGSGDAGRTPGDSSSAVMAAQPQPHRAPSLSFPSQMLMSAISQDAWRPVAGAPGGDINLSFLDLHYYSSTATQGIMTNANMLNDPGGRGGGRQGQALDLAAAPLTSSASLRALGIPASLRQHIPRLAGGVVGNVAGAGVRSGSSLHQRGHSAVCPKDLVLRSGDNKRKRASWDGAHS